MAESVAVIPASPELTDPAREIAARWGLSVATGAEEGIALWLTPERLVLQEAGPDAPGPVYVDFVGGAVGHRRRFGGGRGQPIAKAAGLKPRQNPSIFDATAGLGRDAFVFASLGCEVTLIERSPVAAALLEDGLRRAAADPEVATIAGRMHLRVGDALEALEYLQADVVYLDPMYPHRDSSAQVKKEMRLFQALLGPDADADRLLPAALHAARGRVVVKRPSHAEPLAGQKPTVNYPTRNHRFDVYVIKALDP